MSQDIWIRSSANRYRIMLETADAEQARTCEAVEDEARLEAEAA